MSNEPVATTFAELGVSEPVAKALKERGITDAFPIQTATIEAALAARDICGKAPTGSGKTLAFGVPAVDLANEGTPWRPSVLILSPTRELASQIKDELEPLAKAHGRSILTVFGGTNIERDIKRLEKGIDILVACPGRLEDLIGRRCCELRNVEICIVDEADRMADMGFLPSIKRILDQTPGNRHTMLFSATLDGDVNTLIKRYQNDPLTFEVEEQAGDVGDVEHSWYLIQPVNRVGSAVAILQRYESSIVFCRTRRGCDRVAKMFAKNGLAAVAIHGDRSQGQRERALKDFTSGKAQVLVATDVAARGIHVDNVALVMHYDPAGSDKDYIHRSGRTGRAGQDGRVISMVVEDKKKIARALQKDLGLKPGYDDIELESAKPAVKRKPYVEPEPQSKKQSHGKKQSSSRSDGGSNRDRSGRNRDRNERDRDKRDRNSRDRNERDRGGRNRNDRDDRGGNRDGGRNSRDRNERDRGGRDRNDRDDRGGNRKHNDRDRDNRGARNRNDRDRNDRDRNDRGTGNRRPRPRPGSNDWYPKDYFDDDKRSGQQRSSSKKRGSGGYRGDDEREERPTTGGRNTKQRKNRAAKGRHSDKPTNKNKGKRRSPRR